MALTHLSVEWMMIMGAVSLMAGFLVGQAMDAVMGQAAFGPLGNMLIMTAAFHGGLIYYDGLWNMPDGTEFQLGFAIAVAFAALLLFTLLKRILTRN